MYYVIQALEHTLVMWCVLLVQLQRFIWALLFWFALLIVRFSYVTANYLPVHNREITFTKESKLNSTLLCCFCCWFALSFYQHIITRLWGHLCIHCERHIKARHMDIPTSCPAQLPSQYFTGFYVPAPSELLVRVQPPWECNLHPVWLGLMFFKSKSVKLFSLCLSSVDCHSLVWPQTAIKQMQHSWFSTNRFNFMQPYTIKQHIYCIVSSKSAGLSGWVRLRVTLPCFAQHLLMSCP